MAHIAFHRTDEKRIVFRASLAERIADGTCLNRVANRRAGAMCFDVVNFGGVDAGLTVSLLQ